MLPNHAPLLIAEQFGTLAELYPGRIDLGLGRAPGGDMASIRALRRPMREQGEDRFPHDVVELQAFLGEPEEGYLQAVPGAGTHVPIWILGSSLYGAQLAAHLGLPYAFASHFAPQLVFEAAHRHLALSGFRQFAHRPARQAAAAEKRLFRKLRDTGARNAPRNPLLLLYRRAGKSDAGNEGVP